MTCQALVELITDYLEGTLSPSDRARFEAHLSGCVACRGYLDQMRGTIRAIGRLAENDVPPNVRDELLALFRDWRSG